jgi:glycosyltransferase involved in cell wall biosynthesis
LLVFADDWGRHPSSCQHLIRHLLPEHQVHWVNTIGTRTPRLDWETFRRGLGKLGQWLKRPAPKAALPDNLRVTNPKMWPSFRSSFGRWMNRKLLTRHLVPLLRNLPEQPVGVTTIPMVADILDDLPVRRWVYYCVDDFSTWPGLDQNTMGRMERQLLERVDEVVAVSENLQERLAGLGRTSTLLTHGVDLDFWTGRASDSLPELNQLPRPLVVFFGLIDRRLDLTFLARLGETLRQGTILLVGPQSDPDPALSKMSRLTIWPALRYEQLPTLARAADVLMMPYADLTVTRAMQPLKLKEYLAASRPAVVRDLPANREWADCLDLAASPEGFADAVLRRIQTGLPEDQRTARYRLQAESWAQKARQFEQILQGEKAPHAPSR